MRTPAEALDWLYGTQLTGTKLGLENMRRLSAALGLGERPGPPTFRFVHVAGTNGKGSVCALVDAVLRAHGVRSGLFTSPHLVRFEERIRCGGEPMPAEALLAGLQRLRALTEGWDPTPTFFELTTALALDHFRREGIEWIAWETGLGGRLDATNIVEPVVSVITSLGLDHREYLGNTLTEIAREKAGIVKPGVPALTVPGQAAEAALVLAAAGVQVVEESWNGPLGLRGRHQRPHAALAVAALRAAGFSLDPRHVTEGLAAARWPGRFEVREAGRLVLDGAHNPAAAALLVDLWREEFGTERATVIFAAMRDKDVAGVLAALAPIAARFMTTAARNPRAAEPAELAAAAAVHAPAESVATLAESLPRARQFSERLLLCGSLFLVGEAIALLDGADAPRRSTQ
ncbi:MAG: bifunctional folylpolyglutamate synthase/dihydrofolate synthase [Verrucomicrobia bacterium]|nr:bifunctional folylpolyglutamate synthase/dihydrofolate synthase [Verrucomicrobiota bacterium]